MSPKSTKDSLTIRLSPGLKTKIEEARKALPYPITATALVERGIALAIAEINSLAAKKENGE